MSREDSRDQLPYELDASHLPQLEDASTQTTKDNATDQISNPWLQDATSTFQTEDDTSTLPQSRRDEQTHNSTPSQQPYLGYIRMSDHCRSPLDVGIPIDTLDPESQSAVIETWMAAKTRIAAFRNQILTSRMDVKRERIRCQQQEEMVYNIMDDIIALLDTARGEPFKQCKEELHRLSKALKTARQELRDLRETCTATEDALSSQEYRLTELEEGLYAQIDAEFKSKLQLVMPTTPRTDPDGKNTYGARDMHISTGPRDELYSRMSDLRILIDRLNDFEYELREELDERDVLRAAGQPDLSNDEQFFTQAKLQRSRIQQDLEQAQADVARLKEQCRILGLEFEDVQFYNPFVDHHTDMDTESATAMSDYEQPETVVGQESGSSSILESFFKTRERVKNWLAAPSPLTTGRLSGPTVVGEPSEPEQQRRPESQQECGWVMTPRISQHGRRPSSAGNDEGNHEHMPQWTAGPPAGSALLEALLLDSVSETSKRHPIRKAASYTTL